MTRSVILLLKASATLAACALASTPALSDVLELDGGNARWVAGGPVSRTPDTAHDIPPEIRAVMGLEVQTQDQANIAQMVAQLPQGQSGARPLLSPLSQATLTSRFGYRSHPILGGQRMHSGIDLSAPEGTPVYATATGVVTGAGWLGGYGLLIELAHADELQTRYGHLSRLAVTPGQVVAPGELIGFVGSTGRSTGPHLHYEVRLRGAAIDPLPYMRGQ
jgi:murein DD-endopeptidase MepM/ murein hydrolase activator NlpD